MPEPKGIALIIGKRLDKKDGKEEGEREGGEQEEMEHSAVADLIAAIHSKDVQAARDALCDFIELYEGGEHEEHEEEDGEEY